MAVAVQLDFEGATLEQYDQINERIRTPTRGSRLGAGTLSLGHEDRRRFRVVDVWESREAFERFEREKLTPTYEEVGICHPPEIQFFEVHNYFPGGRWRA